MRRKNIFVRIWLKIKAFFKKLFSKKEKTVSENQPEAEENKEQA